MSEDQEDAIRNAWLDLSAMVEHISRWNDCEELVKAGSDSIKELEENFEFLKQR